VGALVPQSIMTDAEVRQLHPARTPTRHIQDRPDNTVCRLCRLPWPCDYERLRASLDPAAERWVTAALQRDNQAAWEASWEMYRAAVAVRAEASDGGAADVGD
jgi:hypothetical protein